MYRKPFLVMASVCLCILSLCVIWTAPAEAETASWGPNDTVADFAGTKVYRAPGTCATPGSFAMVGNFPKPAVEGPIADPTTDGKYCFRATHYDTAANESLFSNTVEWDYNVVPPKAPVLSVRP